VPDVRDLLHLGTGGDEPSSVRLAGSRIRTRSRLPGRIFVFAVPDVHDRRIRLDRADVLDADHPVLRRLAYAGSDPGRGWPAGLAAEPWRPVGLHREDDVLLLPVRNGEGDRAALPLRPADASRLEDLPADLAGRRGDRRSIRDLHERSRP